MREKCDECGNVAGSFHFNGNDFVCRSCYCGPASAETCRPFEFGHENPQDPKGSTAHVRDIKARRIDPKTKTLFYYQPPKSYFY